MLSDWQKKELAKDMSQNLINVLREIPGTSPAAALRKVTTDMLANNPFIPPTVGCPINDLPNELLAHIFILGTQMEDDSDGDEDNEDEWEDEEDEDEDMEEYSFSMRSNSEIGKRQSRSFDIDEDEDYEPELAFQVLVSHVCRHWREIALQSPILWTKLNFFEGPPFEKSRIWIQRSKNLPLDISIDCTMPEDEHEPDDDPLADDPTEKPVSTSRSATHGERYEEDHRRCEHEPGFYSLDEFNTILDIIIPHVAQWRLLELSVSFYVYMHTALSRFAECPSAPLLEVLWLYHYEDGGNELNDEDVEFEPPKFNTAFLVFNGIAPNLQTVTLWGVHLDWERSLPMFTGLRDLELAYHAKNVRPSFATFSQILAASPELNNLTLCLSGPAEHQGVDNEWGTVPIEVPSVKDLVLCYHDPAYIIALMRLLCTPNVTSLVLDYDGADYSEFARALTLPMPGKSKSLLAGLAHLKIGGFPCNRESAEMLFDQLSGLHSINLNCLGDEEELFFELLLRPTIRSIPSLKTYCPNLNSIWTSGITGEQMKKLIDTRKAAGVPIKRVFMSSQDTPSARDEKWIKDHVESLEYFDPSDSEEEFTEVEVSDWDPMEDDE